MQGVQGDKGLRQGTRAVGACWHQPDSLTAYSLNCQHCAPVHQFVCASVRLPAPEHSRRNILRILALAARSPHVPANCPYVRRHTAAWRTSRLIFYVQQPTLHTLA